MIQATNNRFHINCNMDIRRLPYLSDKDIKRLKKYLKAYKRLTTSDERIQQS